LRLNFKKKTKPLPPISGNAPGRNPNGVCWAAILGVQIRDSITSTNHRGTLGQGVDRGSHGSRFDYKKKSTPKKNFEI